MNRLCVLVLTALFATGCVMQSTYDALQKDHDSLKADLDRKRADSAELQAQLEALETKSKELAAKIKAVQADLEKSQTDLGKKQAELDKTQAERDAAAAEVVSLNTRAKEIAVDAALYGSGVQVFEAAELPESPCPPPSLLSRTPDSPPWGGLRASGQS